MSKPTKADMLDPHEGSRWRPDYLMDDDDDSPVAIGASQHVFEGERCIYCNVNTYDNDLYSERPEVCPVEHEPLVYTTETGDDPVPDLFTEFMAYLNEPAEDDEE